MEFVLCNLCFCSPWFAICAIVALCEWVWDLAITGAVVIFINKKSRCTVQNATLDSCLKPVNSVVRIKSGSAFRNLADALEKELRP